MLDVKYFKYNVATSVHKKFLSIHYFSFSYGVVNELIADVSFVLGSFKLCYIQNLVKKLIFKVKNDFWFVLKKNLNILAKSRRYFSIPFLVAL